MSRIALSELYWGCWIFLLFLVPELLAFFGVIPMFTLSRTSWMDQESYPILRTIIFGFLVGLAVHIRFTTGLWKAEAGGIGVSLVVHLAWGFV